MDPAEEDFQILIDKKNEGYLLKNFGEKGWGLFNLQSYAVVMGGNNGNLAASTAKNLQDDPFSTLLANVVRDSTILEKNEPTKKELPAPVKVDSTATEAVKAAPPKADSTGDLTAKGAPVSDSAVVNNGKLPPPGGDSLQHVMEKPSPVALLPAARFLSKKNKDGREMIYIDHNQGLNDTIRIFIPSRRPVVKAVAQDSSRDQHNKPDTGSITDSATVARGDSGVVQNNLPPTVLTDTTSGIAKPAQADPGATTVNPPELKSTAETKDPAPSKAAVATEPARRPEDTSQVRRGEVIKADGNKKDDIVVLPRVVQSSSTNSDCKAFASNEDFLKLRKKMAAENSDDNMIRIARKAFHTKCFSTEQIKNISFLFLTNAGKYMFFDLAYPFASDSEQYQSLESQLTDSYYINRFKAMIHK